MLVFNQTERGTYWRAFYIARELCRRGHTVTLLATAPRERRHFKTSYHMHGRLALVETPDLLRGSLRSGWDPWDSLLRAFWLDSSHFDLIHAFECRPTVLVPALIARKRHNKPLVMDWCDWFGRGGSVEERTSRTQRIVLRPVETFFEERFRNRADATTVINHTLAQRAIELGVSESSITLVPNGCDTLGWNLEPRHLARAALALPREAPLICYVGALFQRDAALLAQAFDQLHTRCSQARLIVLGYCNIEIERYVDCPEAVIRTGPLETATLRRYLRASDVGWIPLCDSGANRGRWPLKLNTYMEAGLPFVTTSVGDLSTFIQRYPVGLAAAADPTDLAEQTLTLLNNPTRAAKLGATGRYLAETELNWTRVTETVEQVYEYVITTYIHRYAV